MSYLSNHSQDKKIAFIGAGNMATAIIAGLIEAGWDAKNIFASNPSEGKLLKLKNDYSIHISQDNQTAAEFADVLILAVKPQKLADVCYQLRNVDLTKTLIISIAAGFPIQKMSDSLNQSNAIVRVMPNTPSLIGKGVCGMFANSQTNDEQKQITETIFSAVGEYVWLTKESQMDIVTAIAGSSPAYIFLLMQAMIEQAVDSGLNESDAFQLVTQAVSGAAQLAQQTPEKSLHTLRKEVTSPGGTTAAAISSFKANDFEQIVKKAVKASIDRGKELGQQS